MCLQNSKAAGVCNCCHQLRPGEIGTHRGNHYWSNDSEAFTKPSLQHPTSLTGLRLREKYRLTSHTHDDIAGLRRFSGDPGRRGVSCAIRLNGKLGRQNSAQTVRDKPTVAFFDCKVPALEALVFFMAIIVDDFVFLLTELAESDPSSAGVSPG